MADEDTLQALKIAFTFMPHPMEMNRFAYELVRSGRIGRIKAVLGVCYPGPRDYDGLPGQPIPEGDDWDRWQSATASRPF
ncbi:hypothetical protein LCGC14_0917140, partial [marine sediment metagenome]